MNPLLALTPTRSVSDTLSLSETLTRLQASPQVDGILEFGSRAASQTDAASDYDLLLLVSDIPARVFQMVTTIDGCIADIVLVETETADALLTAAEPPAPHSFEGLFARKAKTGRILYDASGRLSRVRERVTREDWYKQAQNKLTDAALYDSWFWQSFGLLHIERMAQSASPVHETAVDMMLTAVMPGTWRSYFELRGVAWEGEKAAVRYWTQHDAAYLTLVNQCLAPNERSVRLTAYKKLLEQTLEPVAAIFNKGDTAIMLANSTDTLNDIKRTIEYWNGLFAKAAV